MVSGRYFALVAAPVAVALLLLLGVGPRLAWTSADAGYARRWPASSPPGGRHLVRRRRPLAVLMVGLAASAGALTVVEWRRRPRARWPLAHLGVAVLLAGVAGTTTGTQVTAPLSAGAEVTVRGYTVRLDDVVPRGVRPRPGRPSILPLRRDEDTLAILRPVALVSEQGQRVSVAALRSTPVQDVQVALRAVGDGGEAVVEIAVAPLMQFVWWGGLLVVAGLAWSAVRAGPPAQAQVVVPPATRSAVPTLP